jgi:AcrR family transcriptional regulator
MTMNLLGCASMRPQRSPDDPRVKRSQRALADAMAALLVERPYAEISVSDIVGRAEVSRATFYLHFGAKEDLLAHVLDGLFETLGEGLELSANEASIAEAVGVAVFRFSNAHGPLLTALARTGANGVLAMRTEAYILGLMQRFADRLGMAPDQDKMRFAASFLAGASAQTLLAWLAGGMKESPEAVGRAFGKLAEHGLAGWLG